MGVVFAIYMYANYRIFYVVYWDIRQQRDYFLKSFPYIPETIIKYLFQWLGVYVSNCE